MLQAGYRPKKSAAQPKTRKSGKTRMHPMDDLLPDALLPGDPNYVSDEEEFAAESPAPLTVVSLGNSPVRIVSR